MADMSDRIRSRDEVDFRLLARKIGLKLRDVYGHPEAEQLPVEQVQLLLNLRQKEREASRR